MLTLTPAQLTTRQQREARRHHRIITSNREAAFHHLRYAAHHRTAASNCLRRYDATLDHGELIEARTCIEGARIHLAAARTASSTTLRLRYLPR